MMTKVDTAVLKHSVSFSEAQAKMPSTGSTALQSLASGPYRGLCNLGATCYLNATLQVLFMTQAFRERVLRRTPGDTSEKLETALKELFEELSDQDGGAQSVSTKGVIKALSIQR
ncbi:hypothetical protein cypCar_00035860, partial [Cyprinus carpio]